MIEELIQIDNRRQWQRINRSTPVVCETISGYTLNLSLRGARIVTRESLRELGANRFRLRIQLDQPMELEAELVWKESLGDRHQVAGVRFVPTPEEQRRLQDWMERAA